MTKNSDDFSEAMRLAQSPAGQQLLAFLRQADSDALNKAGSAAASGDYGAAMSSLRQLLSNPEAQKLLTQLGGGAHE